MLGRIKASLEDPLGLEHAGYCLLDMAAERRGNLFQDEVYRLTKARDATTTIHTGSTRQRPMLPAQHKFSNGDVIVLTQQPLGSGDFFTPQSLPITDTAVTAEARVLNTGPTYIDVALSGGAFAAAFGSGGRSDNNNDNNNKYDSKDFPQPGSRGGDGQNRDLRVRVDRFVSNVPYQRMVAALSQLTAIPENKREVTKTTPSKGNNSTMATVPQVTMDDFFKELIVSTYAFSDPNSLAFHDPTVCNIEELVRLDAYFGWALEKLLLLICASATFLLSVPQAGQTTHGIFSQTGTPSAETYPVQSRRNLSTFQCTSIGSHRGRVITQNVHDSRAAWFRQNVRRRGHWSRICASVPQPGPTNAAATTNYSQSIGVCLQQCGSRQFGRSLDSIGTQGSAGG